VETAGGGGGPPGTVEVELVAPQGIGERGPVTFTAPGATKEKTYLNFRNDLLEQWS